MSDVVVGKGALAGKGLYAGRDFAAGEPVVSFELQGIDEAQYLGLTTGEDLFVHSYGGRRYLYPAPARFVNQSDDPSCVEDFDRCCDVALTDIAKGEPITIDATRETARELATFLDALTEALQARSAPLLRALVDGGAILWRLGDVARGRDEVVAALLAPEPKPLSGVEWFVGTGRWEAVCSAGADIDGRRQHVTIVVKIVLGNWQLVYQHIG